ncbi:MAG: hypothetical protein M1822_008338 [Bathelium mastoideum]|nr:MAG: hypothetical protein M1822_008338 [Bathelium mastoideum]
MGPPSQPQVTHSERNIKDPAATAKTANGASLKATSASTSSSVSLAQLPPIPSGYLSAAPFVHNSISTSSRISAAGDQSYERLEFLGDAYIQIISSRILYSRFPEFPAGKLANTRQSLVRNDTLARFSRQYGFDQKVKATEDVRKSDVWDKVVADVFEAYTASVVLGDPEKGFETAEAWLGALWEPQLREIEQAKQKTMSAVNAKEELRKMVASPGVKIEYMEERPRQNIKSKGETEFFYGCLITGWGYEKKHLGSGAGYSQMAAGNNAALDAMESQGALLQVMAKQKSVFDKKRRQEREAAALQAP